MSISNPQPLAAVSVLNIDQILGVAVFDAMGLPCDSFITSQHPDTEWVQLVFQSLGLQHLVASVMELPALDHGMIRTKVGNIIVVGCQSRYIALLVKRSLPQERPQIDSALVDWICDFEATVLRNHLNFRAV